MADTRLLNEEDRPLLPNEYFDHVNDCTSAALNWIDGDAYCPDCGQPGVVYERKERTG